MTDKKIAQACLKEWKHAYCEESHRDDVDALAELLEEVRLEERSKWSLQLLQWADDGEEAGVNYHWLKAMRCAAEAIAANDTDWFGP